MLGTLNQKIYILKLLAISFALMRNSPMLLRIDFGYSDSLVFREIPFHVFLILLMLDLE